MIPFIDKSRLEQIYSGSIENGLDNAKLFLENHFKNPVDVIASFQDHLFIVVEGDERIRRVGLKIDDDGVSVSSVRFTGGLVTESTVDGYVSSVLSEAVEALLAGERCNRLRDIVPLVQADGRYFFSEEYSAVMHSSGAKKYWESLYEMNRKDIRKAIYGSIREEEAKVPKARYSSVNENEMLGFSKEVVESIQSLIEMSKEIMDDISGIDPNSVTAKGWDVKKVLDTIKEECNTIVVHGPKSIELSKKANLTELAEMHDRVADLVRNLLVMKKFISISTI